MTYDLLQLEATYRVQFFYQTVQLCIRPMVLDLIGTIACFYFISPYSGFEKALRLILLTLMVIIRQGSEIGIFYQTVWSGWTSVAAMMHLGIVTLVLDQFTLITGLSTFCAALFWLRAYEIPRPVVLPARVWSLETSLTFVVITLTCSLFAPRLSSLCLAIVVACLWLPYLRSVSHSLAAETPLLSLP